MKISYLGPIGTFSYEAAKNNASQNDELIESTTITQAINKLISDEVQEAVVPLENSIQGSVFETIDNLLSNELLYIKKDFALSISHNLLINKNTNVNDITEIISHPQALAQCRKYLNQNFPNAILTETISTATAAKLIVDKVNSACISNLSCKDLYNLELVESNIQENDHNKTRFVVLTKENTLNSNKDKISIYFSTLNKPGELYKILGLFNIFNVNLSKIESRPAKTILGEYVFWIDFENDATNKSIPILLDEIKKRCSSFRILGCY